jgi:hypothetical protein
MHVIHPHLPREVTVTLTAALATLLIALMLVPRLGLGNVRVGQNQASSPSHPTLTRPGPPRTARPSVPAAPQLTVSAWPRKPFTALMLDPVASRWTPAAPER